MNIIFTGSSSFTGMWFIEELSKAGHSVTATFLRPFDKYLGIKKERLEKVKSSAFSLIDNCPFGSESFFELIESKSHWDLLCHHAADVTNYKNLDFDYIEAVRKNTNNIDKVLKKLQEKGCNKVLLTGSVFEQREGIGSDELRAVSPYGLSKGLTADIFKYYCNIRNINLGKFVIPNPFGPYEEDKFTSFLIKNWFNGKIAPIGYPDYIRDNIHVSLLALSYVNFSQNLNLSYQQINPSQYAESQANFTKRFSNEMQNRLGMACDFEISLQKDFMEPLIRINSDQLNYRDLKWNETTTWDALANYYLQKHQ